MEFQRLLFIFAVILLAPLTGKAIESSCWNTDVLQSPKVQFCASSQTIFPDASQTTAAVFLSYIVSRNDEVIVRTYDLLKKYSPETKLNILISKNGVKNYQEYRKYCSGGNFTSFYIFLCRMEDLFNDKQNVTLIQLSRDEDLLYPQDYLQFALKGNTPVLFPVPNPYETQDFINKDGSLIPKTSVEGDVARQCSLGKLNLDVPIQKGFSATMGGNIESIPGGGVILGRSSRDDFIRQSDDDILTQLRKGYSTTTTEEQFKTLIQDIHGMVRTQDSQEALLSKEIAKPVKLDTSFAPVTHADEVFSIVRSNSQCGFSVLVPSPAVAIELMKKSKVEENKANCIKDASNGISGLDDLQKLNNHAISGCIGFRGKTFSEFLENQDVLDLNEKFEQVSRANSLLIKDNLRNTACKSVDFVRLPYLISKNERGGIEGAVPNPVNALVISPVSGIPSIYINNYTFVSAFDSYIANELTSRGIIISRLKTTDYFNGQGGLHCGSNTIQLCRQK